ncbi:MAG: hypothetical protein MI810_09895 [Flavobacteriales bacterium]|nr:hypothetical protein [Flavobacteriales bacterium]
MKTILLNPIRGTLLLLITLFSVSNNLHAQEEIENPFSPGFETGKTNGEIIKATIAYWDHYYNTEFFDKGKIPGKGTGYNPYLRWKTKTLARLDSTGEIPLYARWTAFEEYHKNFQKAGGQWENVGPVQMWDQPRQTGNTGRLSSYAFHPKQDNILFVGADDGGLWKGTFNSNGSDTVIWEPLTDHIPTTSVGAIAINPQNPNSIILGTGSPLQTGHGVGVLISNDGGKSWDTTSFSEPQSANIQCYDLAWDPQDSNTVYLGASNGFWISRDAGNNWSKVKNGTTTSIVLNPKNSDSVYVAIQADSVYRSTNGGVSWHSMDGLPSKSTLGNMDLAICDSFPNYLYITIINEPQRKGRVEGIYKTTDGGNNWNKVGGSATQFLTCYGTDENTYCQGGYNNIIAVSDIDTNKLFFGGIRMHQSVDGGKTWTLNGTGDWSKSTVHVDVHGVHYDPYNPNSVFVFCDGGVWRSKNEGTSWQSLNDSLVTFQFYQLESSYTNPGFIVGGAQDNGVSNGHVNDSLEWWHNVTGDGGLLAIDPYLTNTFYYLEGTTLMQILSTNPTNHRTSIAHNISSFTIDTLNGRLLLYATSPTSIIKSDDRGASWTTLKTISEYTEANQVRKGQILMADGDTTTTYVYANSGGWVYHDNNWHYYQKKDTLWYSNDKGETWTGKSLSRDLYRDFALNPNNLNTLYAVRSTYSKNQQVWKSTNNGESWTNVSNNFPPIPAQTIAVTNDSITGVEIIYVGTDLGVYMAYGNDYNWFKLNNNLPNVIVSTIHPAYADTTVRVGTFGRAAWKHPIPCFPNQNVVISNQLPKANFYGSQQGLMLNELNINRDGQIVTLAAEENISIGTNFSLDTGTELSIIIFSKIEN